MTVSESPKPGPPGVLRVHAFGGLRVTRGGRERLTLPPGSARRLLAYLILQPHPHAREAVAEALWPESSATRGRRAMSDALYRLRGALGRESVVADRTTVTLAADRLWVDAWEFERLSAGSDAAALEAAIDLYDGPLLPELFDDWVLGRRLALEERYLRAVRTLAEAAERDGRIDRAFDLTQRLILADPLDEAAHQGLMRIYHRSADPRAVLQQYERLSALLRTELDVDPLPETRALADRARSELTHAREIRPNPFVGRATERHELLATMRRADAGRASLVLVEGDAGVGKSRLLEAAGDDARWRGIRVMFGRASGLAALTPFAPIDEALHGVPRAGTDAIAERLSPAARAAVAIVAPGLPLVAHRPMPERPSIAAGLASFFHELTRDETWALILDDVHNAGASFWDALAFLQAADEMRLLVILAYRPAELRSNDAGWEAVRTLDAWHRPRRMSLSGLSTREALELARAVADHRSAAEVERLRRDTSGYPLFLLEALRASGTRSASSSFETLLRRRLDDLTGDQRAALEVASVLGASFSHTAWRAAGSEIPDTAISELIELGFLDVRSDRYAFQHDLARQVVYDDLGTDRRRELHARAAGALRGDGAEAAIIAWHLERGHEPALAVDEYLRAAVDAAERFAHRVALDHAERGLALLGPAQGDMYARLLGIKHRALGLLLRTDEWRASLDEAEEHAVASGDDHALLEALEDRMKLHTLDGDIPALTTTSARALRVSRKAGDQERETRILIAMGWHLAESRGESGDAVRLLRRAVSLADGLSDTLLFDALRRLSLAQLGVGRCRAAHITAARAMALIEMQPHLYAARAHALEALASVSRELARWEEARSAMRSALSAHEELDDPWARGSLLYDLSLVASAMGQHREAVESAIALLDLSRSLGLGPTSDYGAWHLAALAAAQLGAGDLEAAQRTMEPVVVPAIRAERPRISVLTVLGRLKLERGDASAAAATFGEAASVWRRAPRPQDVAAALWASVAYARANQRDRARALLAIAEDALTRTDVRRHDVLLHLARFETTGQEKAAHEAARAIRRQADAIRDPALREAFVTQPSLRDLVGRSTGTPSGRVVPLARLDAPLGRTLAPSERVGVAWTVDQDAVPGSSRGERRRQIISRLLAQAQAAGASATDEDLARALGVSRRTILRDMRILATDGAPIRTRRRRG